MPQPPSLSQMFSVFGRIGLLSFGGPAAQISLMHRELVQNRPWLDEAQFLRALSFCMLLPGPEAMQLATYAGWRLRGVPGGVLAGLLFVLPGACVVATLAAAYISFGTQPAVQAAFLGVKAAVLVVVLQALLALSRRSLEARAHWLLAACAFVALFVLQLPFPVVIALAGLWGFFQPSVHTDQPTPAAVAVSGARHTTLGVVLFWGALWLAPLAVLWLLKANFLLDLSLFFSQLAVVTFGGAYAVLAYMTQTIVSDFGWLDTRQMIDALGLAETTPGPLILVTQFVGILAGHGQGGWPMAALAGALTLWMTFVPCFLWIFAGAPYIERLSTLPRLANALHAITAAVVGVILSLSLWFGLHVLFAQVTPTRFGPMPDWASLDLTAAALAALAAIMLQVLRLPLPLALAGAALMGVALQGFGPGLN